MTGIERLVEVCVTRVRAGNIGLGGEKGEADLKQERMEEVARVAHRWLGVLRNEKYSISDLPIESEEPGMEFELGEGDEGKVEMSRWVVKEGEEAQGRVSGGILMKITCKEDGVAELVWKIKLDENGRLVEYLENDLAKDGVERLKAMKFTGEPRQDFEGWVERRSRIESEN